MGDDITIGVTEIVNNIEVTAQPNDQIVELSVVDNADDVTLNITPTVIEINVNKGSSYAKWGTILGTLSDQEDLQDALDLKADLVDGKVPSSQLPSYVDDVIEVANYAALPSTGESGKIYITLDDNHIYRWTGSTYVEITDNTAVWGAITGTLSDQTDLQSALSSKMPFITFGAPLSISGTGNVTIQQSTSSANGFLSSTDWNTFNNKLSSLSGAVLTTTDQNISGVKTFTDSAKFTNGTGSFAIEIDVTTSGALVVKDTGTTKLQIGKNGEILAAKYKINGGFSSQFLKANGDLDSTIYTPASRTLTINGTSYDLSADRSWTIATHDAVTIGTANGLSLSGQALSLGLASSSTNGALSSTDWTTFNNKLSSLSGAVLTTTNQDVGGIKTFTDLTIFSESGIRIGSQGWVTPNQVYNEGTDNFYVNYSGAGHTIIGNSGKNVGIGTTSPATKLEVAGAIRVNDGYGVGFALLDNSSITREAEGMSLNTNSTRRVLISTGGNVGIGTTTPTSKIHVSGLSEFATNAAAISGGLTAGAFYHTAGVLKVVI